jgi:hypothetical protein
MKADFSSISFDPTRRFARVLMQQGRVQLDADWNEQAAILLRYLHALAADLIGPFGGPRLRVGFVVQEFPAALAAPGNFLLAPGHYYVDGILCENDPMQVPVASVAGQPKQLQVPFWTLDGAEFDTDQYLELLNPAKPASMFVQVAGISQATSTITLDQDVSAFAPVSLRRVTTYLTQPDLPAPAQLPASNYLAYLDVWERLVTYVEDDAIREVALNGSDTAARSKVVFQVKAMPPNTALVDPTTLIDAPNRDFLRARSLKTAVSTDPCTISPNAQYRGPENQLYRVEIHTGSGVDAAGNAAKPTFKWSRDNGAAVFPIVRSSGAASFVLESLGRDDRFGLTEGDWVEIQDDDSVLLNRAENLLQVQSIDRPGLTVTLAGTPSSNTGKSPAKHPLLRRWDQQFGDSSEGGLDKGPDNAALVVEGSGDAFLDLENGVQIQFVPNPAGEPLAQYRTGDYWRIPARVATGDVEWPTEAVTDAQGVVVLSAIALPPQGIEHHYAPLANITVAAVGGAVKVTKTFTKTITQAAV